MTCVYRDDARRARESTRPMQRPVAPGQESFGSRLKNARNDEFLPAPGRSATGTIGGAVAWGGMAEPPSSPNAGGFLIAGAIVVGAIVGVVLGEPTIGTLAGTALGIAGALIVWLRDRARRG
jgi:hypothetical protein